MKLFMHAFIRLSGGSNIHSQTTNNIEFNTNNNGSCDASERFQMEERERVTNGKMS